MTINPITPITLEDASKRKYAFRPQSDMTALESAMICQLFVKMTLNRSGDALDWPAYVEDHRLWRHFTDPLAIVPIPLDITKLANMGSLLDDAKAMSDSVAGINIDALRGTTGNEPIEAPKKITIQCVAQPELSVTIAEDMEIPPGWEIMSDEQLLVEAGAGGVK